MMELPSVVVAPLVDRSLHGTQQESAEVATPAFSQRSYTIIGQLHLTYLLLETTDGLLIIDQHAAHERVIYEELQCATTPIPSTMLLFPECISLHQESYMRIVPHLERLRAVGIIAEPWGDATLKLSATAPGLSLVACKEVLELFAAQLHDITVHKLEEVEKTIYHELRAMVACKAAVKAGDQLQHTEIHTLIDRYLALEQRLTCPHGRPTSWHIKRSELEKNFKR
jgi:DNA mismatch repair protein MutL